MKLRPWPSNLKLTGVHLYSGDYLIMDKIASFGFEKSATLKSTLMLVWLLWLAVGPAIAEDLIKLSLDDVSSLGLTIESDPRVKVEGRSSIRITTLYPTTVCLGEVNGLDLENSTLNYSARVKSQLDGTALLEMWVEVGGGRYFSRGLNSTVKGNTDWKTIQTPFIFQKGQRPEKITLNLIINGHGTVWIDNVVLSKAPLN